VLGLDGKGWRDPMADATLFTVLTIMAKPAPSRPRLQYEREQHCDAGAHVGLMDANEARALACGSASAPATVEGTADAALVARIVSALRRACDRACQLHTGV